MSTLLLTKAMSSTSINTSSTKTEEEYLNKNVSRERLVEIINSLRNEFDEQRKQGRVTYFSESEINMLVEVSKSVSNPNHGVSTQYKDHKTLMYLVAFFSNFCTLYLDCMCVNNTNKAILVVRKVGKSGRSQNKIDDVSSQNIEDFVNAVSPMRIPGNINKAFIILLIEKVMDIIATEISDESSFIISRSTQQRKKLRKQKDKTFNKLPTKKTLSYHQNLLFKFKDAIDSQIGKGGLAAYLAYPSIYNNVDFGLKRKYCLGTEASTGKSVMTTLLSILYSSNFLSVLPSRPTMPKSGYTFDIQSWNNRAMKCQIVAIDDDSKAIGDMTDFLKNFYNTNSLLVGTTKDKEWATFSGFLYMNMNNLTDDFESSKREIRKRIYFLRLDNALTKYMTVDEIIDLQQVSQSDIVDFLNSDGVANEIYEWFDNYNDNVYLDDLLDSNKVNAEITELLDEFFNKHTHTKYMISREFDIISNDAAIDVKLNELKDVTSGKYIYSRRRFDDEYEFGGTTQKYVITRSDLKAGSLGKLRAPLESLRL